MLPTSTGIEPATSWSPVGRASNWATEAGQEGLKLQALPLYSQNHSHVLRRKILPRPKNEMIFYRISELMLATLIQIYDKKSFHFKYERLTEIFADCQVPHFMIVLKLHISLLNLSWIVKCLFFKNKMPFQDLQRELTLKE